jgi:hypothetical protein
MSWREGRDAKKGPERRAKATLSNTSRPQGTAVSGRSLHSGNICLRRKGNAGVRGHDRAEPRLALTAQVSIAYTRDLSTPETGFVARFQRHCPKSNLSQDLKRLNQPKDIPNFPTRLTAQANAHETPLLSGFDGHQPFVELHGRPPVSRLSHEFGHVPESRGAEAGI